MQPAELMTSQPPLMGWRAGFTASVYFSYRGGRGLGIEAGPALRSHVINRRYVIEGAVGADDEEARCSNGGCRRVGYTSNSRGLLTYLVSFFSFTLPLGSSRE